MMGKVFRAPFRPLVFFLQNEGKQGGISALVTPQYVRGVIPGGVIVDKDLHRKPGFLHQKTRQGLPDKFFMVVGFAENGHQRHRIFGPALFCDPSWF
jgi:hypothetical protein